MRFYCNDLGGISRAYSTDFRDNWSGAANLLQRILREGMVVADLGAHVGFYTVLASKAVGQRGRIYAFEPEPRNFRLLQENVTLNRCENVVAQNQAVCDQVGKSALFLGRCSVDHTLHCPNRNRDRIWIETVTLDHFFTGRPSRIDLLRMNIEGSEARALQGMQQFWSANPGLMILTEFAPESIQTAGSTPERFLAMFTSRGLRIDQVADGASAALSPVRGAHSVVLNALGVAYLFIRPAVS
jgi:FkbM family methyltransferase